MTLYVFLTNRVLPRFAGYSSELVEEILLRVPSPPDLVRHIAYAPLSFARPRRVGPPLLMRLVPICTPIPVIPSPSLPVILSEAKNLTPRSG